MVTYLPPWVTCLQEEHKKYKSEKAAKDAEEAKAKAEAAKAAEVAKAAEAQAAAAANAAAVAAANNPGSSTDPAAGVTAPVATEAEGAATGAVDGNTADSAWRTGWLAATGAVDPILEVGATVVVTFGRGDKNPWNQKKGTVTQVLAKDCYV